jgi:Zn-dependent protease with chaperone function
LLPDLTVLISILLGLWSLVEGEPNPLLAVAGTAACTCVAVALSWMAGDRGLRAIEEEQPQVAEVSMRWAGLYPLLGWLSVLNFFEWGMFVETTVSRHWWIGRYLLLYAPAVAMFAAAWSATGRLRAALAKAQGLPVKVPSAREAIQQGARRNGIALVPLMAILALYDGVWLLGEWGVPGVKTAVRWLEALPILSLGFTLSFLLILTIFLPFLFRMVLSTKSLPSGHIRQLLERHAKSIGLRYRDLILWRTGGRVLNAMVVGYTPGTRLIFITDALLRKLPDEEVLAVFAHEAGHAKRFHLPLFLLLFVTTAILFQSAADILMEYGVPPALMVGLHLAFLWFVLLGSISRIFEREADVYGADHAADLDPDAEGLAVPGLPTPLPAGAVRMMKSLERIGKLSGRTHSHRHGSIEERMRFVAAQATDPRVRQAFLKRKSRLLWIVTALTVLSVLVAVWRVPQDVTLARAQISAEDAAEDYNAAVDLIAEGRTEEGTARWQAAYDGFDEAIRLTEGRTSPRALGLHVFSTFNAADTALRGLGEDDRAEALFEDVVVLVKASGLPDEHVLPIRFQAQIELGRLAAHRGAMEEANELLVQARLATRSMKGHAAASYHRERLRLLEAVLKARTDDPETMRAGIATLQALSGGRAEGREWVELRGDAEAELALLREPAD